MRRNDLSNQHFNPIAIIGIGAMYPGSAEANGFWKNIVEGKDLVQEVPPGHWRVEDYYDPDPKATDKTYCKRGAFLDYYSFDPIEYGIPPHIIPATDTSQLLALVVAKEVLNDATAGRLMETDLSRTSVILGAAALESLQYVAARMQRPVWINALKEMGLSHDTIRKICDSMANSYTPWQENTFPGLLGNVIAGRIANRFNLGGTNCITDAACAGSFAALSMAVNELQLGLADLVITGGVDTLNDIVMFMCFSKTQALSLNNDCRPFSQQADGTVLGEGIGMLALKRLDEAEKEGHCIYAVIRGIGTSSDGRSKSIYAPLAQGQSKAIRRAYETAGYLPQTIELIEAHGTGTKAGDVAELEGLNLAFNAQGNTSQNPFCALGSIKSQIGHTKSAAGAAGLLKAALSLHHNVLPPTIKVDQPNAAFHFNQSPFYLNTRSRPWVRDQQHPRRAGVSAFGFGGSNFHVTLEEYTGKNKALRLRLSPTELIILAADNPAALIVQGEALIAKLPHASLAMLAYRSQTEYLLHHLARLAIVASDLNDLRQKLTEAFQLIKNQPEKSFSLAKGIHYGYAINPGKVAFIFPGQGSQYVNMGADLAMAFDRAMAEWDRAAGTIFGNQQHLHDIVFPKPVFDSALKEQQVQQIHATEWAQPALAVTSLVLFKLIQAVKIYPDCVAGHSFGEIVALYAAKVMDEQTLLDIAKKRGELLQQAAMNPGAMLSVLHPVNETLMLLNEWQLDITPANFNSPKQVVLSGTQEAIEKAEIYLKEKNIACRRLSVATGFHSDLVARSQKPFFDFLQTVSLQSPSCPVYANITAKTYPKEVKKIRQYLSEQLVKPVRFQEEIEAIYQNGVRTFIEVGSHTVLTGLIHQCLEQREHHTITLDRKGENGLTSLWNGLGKMIAIGLNPEFNALWQEYRPVKEPSIPSKHALLINGTNYGKPYPPPVGVKETVLSKKDHSNDLLKIEKKENSTINHTILKRGDPMSQHHLNLIQMCQELQKQLVDAHNTYQKSMAESHIAFLNSMTYLAGQASAGINNTNPPLPVLQQNTQQHSAPKWDTLQKQVAQDHVQPVNIFNPEPLVSLSSSTKMSKPDTAEHTPIPFTVPVHAAPLASQPSLRHSSVTAEQSVTIEQNVSDQDLQKLLLDVVVEKTGYPAEMLSLDMAIEGDLGIDSIKRVEILSNLTGRVSHLPEIAPHQLSEIKTLRDILHFMKQHTSSEIDKGGVKQQHA